MTPDDRSQGASAQMPIEGMKGAAAHGAATVVASALKSAGEATGVGFDVLYNMAKRESSLDPNAKAKTSSAAGLFQFIEQTWLAAVKNYGAKHGLADAASAIEQTQGGSFAVADAGKRQEILNLRFDAAKASALAAELVNENKTGLERRLGRAVNDAEIYAAHFLGLGGAVKLLSAAPDAQAAALLPQAAAANKPVFYAGDRAKTVGEVVASIAKSMNVPAPEQAPRLETKSAFPIAHLFERERVEARSSSRYAQPLSAPMRVEASRIDTPRELQALPQLAELFGLRPAMAPASLPPFAIAVLQALDPTGLRARDDRDGRAR